MAFGSEVSRHLLSIYDAAFSADRWNEVMEALVAGTSAKGALLYETSNARDIAYRVSAQSHLFHEDPGVLAEYDTLIQSGRGSGFDHEGVLRMHATAPYTPKVDFDFWEEADFRSRPEVQFTHARLGTFRRFFFNASEDPLSYSGAIFHYDRDHGAPPDHDLAFAAQIAPHLGKSLELGRIAFALRQRYRAVLGVLDRIELGICILDEGGRLILSNAYADDLLETRDALQRTRDGRLICHDPETTERLLDAVSRIARTASGENDDVAEELPLPKVSGGDPLLGILAPLRDADAELEVGLSGAILTIVDARRSITLRVEPFAAAYGLTPTETTIARGIFEGMSNPQIADALGVSPETVKSHVSSVFSKTRSQSRVTLAWRLFQFSPPVS
ncbi:MAG: LuxR C-terminal-related transcriptional regulator [Pseudomonadota bacterium]